MFTLKCSVRGIKPYIFRFSSYEEMRDAIAFRQALRIRGAYACLETGEIWCTTDENGNPGKEEWLCD